MPAAEPDGKNYSGVLALSKNGKGEPNHIEAGSATGPLCGRIKKMNSMSKAERDDVLVLDQQSAGRIGTMKAIRFDHHGEPVKVLAVEERSIPDSGNGEVRIRILASPINQSDLLYVRGQYAGVHARFPTDIRGHSGDHVTLRLQYERAARTTTGGGGLALQQKSAVC